MTKSVVALHFNHLDVTQRVVPVIGLLASCGTDTLSMASHDKESYVAHCFNYLNLMNAARLMAMPLASYDADASVNSVK